MNTTTLSTREIRGRHLANINAVRGKNGKFSVTSSTGLKWYRVDYINEKCDCHDFTFRAEKCKHLFAVQFHLQRNETETKTRTEIAKMPPRRTYSQSWAHYNKSQKSEKKEFQRLLSMLCANIPEPSQSNGRPRLSLADMAFSAIFKVYSTFSGRRFITDLEAAHAQGFISEMPSYNSLFRYFEKPELTPILEALVETSARPLAALESHFSVDATGLGTTHGVTWHHAKYKAGGRMIAKRDWKKLHVLVGTLSNVICAAKVTDKYEHDTNYFAPLMEAASKNFKIEEVSADSAYLTQANLQLAVDSGAFPYIAWKSTSTDTQGNENWNRLYHLFCLNRKQFVEKYGRRGNVETTFSMLKMKFGSTLRSKTDTARVNEGLMKCIAHNLCCLVSAMFELGIEPEFYAKSETL